MKTMFLIELIIYLVSYSRFHIIYLLVKYHVLIPLTNKRPGERSLKNSSVMCRNRKQSRDAPS